MSNADYIAKILGGAGAVRTMTGCKVYAMHDGTGLSLVGLKCRSKYQNVEIVYNKAHDLFNVKFIKIRKLAIVDSITLDNVFISDLKRNIEQRTGLYLSL